MSLHRAKGGGKQCTFVEPTQREGLALSVGAAMQWSKLRDSCNPNFFKSIADAVKRCEGTERDWSRGSQILRDAASLRRDPSVRGGGDVDPA